ncbi:MAG: arginine decarboxylase [Halovenus sp.]|jgi:arginine decarboxylase
MIRVVWGEGVGPTEKASFDAALADAGLHQYNLRRLSSVIPGDTTVESAGTAPSLGPTGNVLDVVLAEQTSQPGARASAGLAWASNAGGGVFYEVGDTDPETVAELLRAGIERGLALRNIDEPVETRVVTADPAPDQYTSAVVAAVYGQSSPLV